jgi:tetratricopeptide (TPR) repeat protein
MAAPASPTPDHRWPAALALLVLTALAYLPALRGGFVWDDDTVLNAFVKGPGGLREFWLTTHTPDYWPVTSSTFWFEWRLWGANPLGYHLTNLSLHLVEALLLWVILRRLRIPGAWLGALLFAVHPVNVESVAWINQRKNLVAMLFYLLSIYGFLRTPVGSPGGTRAPAPGRAGAWYAFSLAAFALAMLSKGSVALLPVVLLGIVAWRRRPAIRDLAWLAPFCLVAGVLTGVDVWFQRHQLVTGEIVRHAGAIERLLGAGAVVWFYLSKAVLPIGLMLFYPGWHIQAGDLLWWLPLLGALALTALLWRTSRGACFAWGYFCVSLVPVMGFTDVYFMKFSLVADHYQHLALIGVTALAGAGWVRLRGRPGAAGAAFALAAVVVALLAALTWRQCGMYRDAETLLETTLRGNPGSALAHNNLGVVLAEEHRLPEAAAQFDSALGIDPAYADAQHNLGLTLARERRWAEAIPHYEEALRLRPNFVDAEDDWGNALLWLGRPAEAIPHFERSVGLNPANAEAQCNLGIALAGLGRFTEAVPHYGEAVRLDPANALIRANLANLLMRVGRVREAAVQYEEVLRLRPDAPGIPAALEHARALAPAGAP